MYKMALQKKDFVEIEFVARVKDGEVFDSNLKEELEKLHHGHDHKIETKPFTFCLGEGMFLKGVDEFLIGKELGKHKINLGPEKAFGKRDPKLIRIVPLNEFKKNNFNPIPGSVFDFDGKVAKILTVSSGRVIVDFNHPLAGKNVEYDVNVLKKVEDLNEKIKSLNEFFFQNNFPFKVEGKKLIVEIPKGAKQFVELFKGKYKELLDLEITGKEIEEKSNNNVEAKEEKSEQE